MFFCVSSALSKNKTKQNKQKHKSKKTNKQTNKNKNFLQFKSAKFLYFSVFDTLCVYNLKFIHIHNKNNIINIVVGFQNPPILLITFILIQTISSWNDIVFRWNKNQVGVQLIVQEFCRFKWEKVFVFVCLYVCLFFVCVFVCLFDRIKVLYRNC